MYGKNGKQYHSYFEKENSEIINSNTAVFYYFWEMEMSIKSITAMYSECRDSRALLY